ncbi:hypothetical protein C1645_832177 [Glomus cerebriforme]|uniref:Uncharacterized protein n=1 Tax=Glomus cerebriforme TaxID=658196 RepID=A0A397SE39_9GLOM|nr:hypothetical protein C1645_832177 [Glomus cerebriforme]
MHSRYIAKTQKSVVKCSYNKCKGKLSITISKSTSKKIQIDDDNGKKFSISLTSSSKSSNSIKLSILEHIVNDQNDDFDLHLRLSNNKYEKNELSEDSSEEEGNLSKSKQFTAPDLGKDKDFKCPNSNIKFSESWILL